MVQLEITGGARIGWANATWPFATLKVSRDKLELNASIIGNLVFQPKDIVSIEPYMIIPLLGQGIKITHRIPTYNSKVIFWTFTDPKTLINQIRVTGFYENINNALTENDNKILEQQKSNGFPIKKSFVIGLFIWWNALFLSDFIPFIASDKSGMPLGYGASLALGSIFLMSILTLISKDFCKLVLKEGQTIKHIRPFLLLLLFISGILLIAVTTMKIS